jgi:RND family efflux transporter MFP subunit
MRFTMIPIFAAAMLSLTTTADAQKRPRHLSTLVGDPVVQETSNEMASVVGRFVSLRGGPVAARVGGAIDEVLVEVGDRVKKGQPMVRLALDRLKAERQRRRALLSLASAKIKTAKATLRLAQQSAGRQVRLRTSAAFSEALLADRQREAERAAAKVKEAEADYGRFRAELKLADVDLAYAVVRAPYDGFVAERHADLGGFLSLGAPVVTLVGERALEVEAEAPTDRMGSLRPGALANIRYAGVDGKVPVRAVLPRETGLSRTRTIRFGPLPPEIAKVALANSSVKVEIPVADAQSVVTVHKDAIVRRASGSVVAVAKMKDGSPGRYQAEFMPVQLGPAIGRRFMVYSGVAPGDIVIIRGNESLRPGQAFKLADRKPAGKPAK